MEEFTHSQDHSVIIRQIVYKHSAHWIPNQESGGKLMIISQPYFTLMIMIACMQETALMQQESDQMQSNRVIHQQPLGNDSGITRNLYSYQIRMFKYGKSLSSHRRISEKKLCDTFNESNVSRVKRMDGPPIS
jgi:hypothetical protein